MSNLTKLAAEFEGLTKSAQSMEEAPEYSQSDKIDALIVNLTRVHHQIKNARLTGGPEVEEAVSAALGQVQDAIANLAALR